VGKGSTGSLGAGTVPGAGLWVACPNCYANCDLSDVGPRLNVLDFNCFLNKFTAGMSGDAASLVYANCNNDEGLNVLDFNCFVNKFVQGCP
jgi:hypothetical protein